MGRGSEACMKEAGDSTGAVTIRMAGIVSAPSKRSVALAVSRFSDRRLMNGSSQNGGPRSPALMEHRRESTDPDRDHQECQLQHEDGKATEVVRRAPEMRDLADSD